MLESRMTRRKIIKKGKWISLGEIYWETEDGKTRTWEYATRQESCGAVCIVAIKRGDPDLLILVNQFRPPLNRRIIELPAGLIEPGETAPQTALKELQEETGYQGYVLKWGPPVYNSPGLTDERVTTVMVEVTSQGNQKLEAEESIEVLEVPLENLRDHLESIHRDGVEIDAKLWCLAEGLSFFLPD